MSCPPYVFFYHCRFCGMILMLIWVQMIHYAENPVVANSIEIPPPTAQSRKCTRDIDCGRNRYCSDLSNLCLRCLDCGVYHRESADRCLTLQQPKLCGPCLAGYVEGAMNPFRQILDCRKIRSTIPSTVAELPPEVIAEEETYTPLGLAAELAAKTTIIIVVVGTLLVALHFYRRHSNGSYALCSRAKITYTAPADAENNEPVLVREEPRRRDPEEQSVAGSEGEWIGSNTVMTYGFADDSCTKAIPTTYGRNRRDPEPMRLGDFNIDQREDGAVGGVEDEVNAGVVEQLPSLPNCRSRNASLGSGISQTSTVAGRLLPSSAACPAGEQAQVQVPQTVVIPEDRQDEEEVGNGSNREGEEPAGGRRQRRSSEAQLRVTRVEKTTTTVTLIDLKTRTEDQG